MVIVGLFRAKPELEDFKSQVIGLTNLEVHVLTVHDIWPELENWFAIYKTKESVEYAQAITKKLKQFRAEDKNVLVLIWASAGPTTTQPVLHSDVAFECMLGLTAPPLYKVVKQKPFDLNWSGEFSQQGLITALGKIQS